MSNHVVQFLEMCRLFGSFLVSLIGEEITIYNFQTLIGGLLALAGALVTVWIVRRQIAQSEKERLDRLARKSRAARSMMPFALAAVCDYSLAVGKFAEMLRNPKGASEADVPPEFSLDAITALKEVVEYAECAWAEPVADLMNDLQVVQSRTKGASARLKYYTSFEIAVETLFNDAKELHGKASRLFDYARQEIEQTTELEPAKTTSFERLVHFSS